MDRKRQLEEKDKGLHRMTFVMPQEIFDLVKKIAKINRRTTTQEMIVAIERYIHINKDLLRREINNG